MNSERCIEPVASGVCSTDFIPDEERGPRGTTEPEAQLLCSAAFGAGAGGSFVILLIAAAMKLRQRIYAVQVPRRGNDADCPVSPASRAQSLTVETLTCIRRK